VSTYFNIDLAHPGQAQQSRSDWFLGNHGKRHLFIVAGAGIALIAVVGLGGVVPRYYKYSKELSSIAALNRNVATATDDATTLRASLRDLGAEARRQVRWSELLPALSRQIPDLLRVDKITLAKAVKAPGGPPQFPQGATPPGDLVLQIDASTPVVAGGARLVEVANFMAALATEPTLERRFQMKTWEVKSNREQASAGLLQVTISLTEKRP
jgi:hypothetical protein